MQKKRARGAGFGGGLKGMRSRETTTGSEGMLPQKKFKFKSSEMARNSSKIVNTGVNF